MANLPEQAVWAPGVFQLEIETPVQGGPNGASNLPLRNLADRTVWLKAQVESLANAPGGAPLESPEFTGQPKVPDVPLGDRSQRAPNTKWVKDVIGGMLTKNIGGQGNFSLSADEVGNAIILLTGVLTGNASVILPVSPSASREWLVVNRTTGNFAVTIKTLAGTGVPVSQGKQASVVLLNGNIERSMTDFADIVLSGTVLAPTAPPDADDQRIANTQWVNRRGNRMPFGGVKQGVTTVSADDAGKFFYVGTGGADVTLPPIASVPIGATYTFHLLEDTYSIFRMTGSDGAPNIRAGGNVFNLLNVKRGSIITFTVDYNRAWWRVGGDAGAAFTKGGWGNWATNGYQQNVNGMLENWGQTSLMAPGASQFITFPMAYPQQLVWIDEGLEVTSFSLTGFTVRNSTGANLQQFWRALGY